MYVLIPHKQNTTGFSDNILFIIFTSIETNIIIGQTTKYQTYFQVPAALSNPLKAVRMIKHIVNAVKGKISFICFLLSIKAFESKHPIKNGV